MKKIPYMLIVGEDEMKSGTVSVRKKSIGDKGKVDLENLISMLNDDMKS